MDTIIALSSGSLPSGVAVIRVSGPSARSFVEALCQNLPHQRVASLQKLTDSQGEVIDSGLVLWFQGPNSFTGEDCAELQVHGGKAVVDKILSEATAMDGIRLAEPGEFARRAFTNGKIDLTEAEGLADLIDAETEAQRKVAVYLASGGLKDLYDGWQSELLDARALIEADIDFADEDDVPGSVAEQVWRDIAALRGRIQQHLNAYGRSEKIRDGFRISLIGRPNVGKSSLLNALAGSDRAIVSEEAGTTRDVVEVRLDLGGYLVLVSDTAGIREGAGAVEAEGIRRSLIAAQSSDLVLHLSDTPLFEPLNELEDKDVIKIRTKIDASPVDDAEAILCVSVAMPEQTEAFVKALSGHVASRMDQSLASSSMKSRYIDHLRVCLDEADKALISDLELEFRAEHLRAAAYSLGRITGQHGTEDVLGRIFSSFCIGK